MPAPLLSSPLSSFRPRACVFDLDGTLVDNMGIHADAFATFAERHGLPPLSPADRHALDGKRNSEIFPVIFGRPLAVEEWRAYEDEKEAVYREISAGRLSAVPGLHRLAAALSAHGIPIAVATSAPRQNVEHTLRELGLASFTGCIVRGDEVAHGKPAPDVFLEAARRLGVPPDACLAFEDAPVGLEAAQRAGMRVVGLATSFTAATLERLAARPELIVRDYDEFLAREGAWLTAAAAAQP